MKKHILFLLLALAVTGIVHADNDPMKSLFAFQQKMASNGSTTAMMKLGEMYEQGVGTKQNLDMALIMYRRARAGGHAGADAAIARVLRTRQALTDAAKRKQERTAETKKHEQQQKQAEAEQQAQLERQAKEQARAREEARQKREAREKARQQALARQRAEQARQREAQARAKAQQDARARAAAAAAAAAEQKARQQALLQKKAAETRAKPVVTEKKTDANQAESFKSDPCKGPAAKVMSICK